MSDEPLGKTITVSAPGRICLFGEHQDYLGLPVIAAAVSLRATLRAEPLETLQFLIEKPEINEREIIDLTAPVQYEKARDYFKSGVRVMQNHGAAFGRGCRVTVNSDIPIGKGCSGSSAILVAWVGLLNLLSGGPRATPEDLARRAYEAEVLEFHEPGGMMDHFASALGGVQFIQTRAPFGATALPAPAGSFVLADSLAPKHTTAVLARVRGNITAGIEYLTLKDPDFQLDMADAARTAQALGADVAEPVRRAVLGNLQNRDLTRRAEALLRFSNTAGHDTLGALLDAHHAALRDDLDISTPRIEAILAAAKRAGAAGGKINGSGGGGCCFVWCPEQPEKVASAVENAGGKAYLISIDAGFSAYQ